MSTHNLGALAQLVERNNGIVEVTGSTPVRSKPPKRCKAALLSFEEIEEGL